MLTGIVSALIVIAVAWAASQWRKKDPESREGKVPPAFEYVGWAFWILVLLALLFSIALAIKNG